MALQVRYYLIMKNVLEPDREKEVWRVLFEISSVAVRNMAEFMPF